MLNMDVRHMFAATSLMLRVSSSPCCDVIRVGGYPSLAANYRPMSLLSVCYKLLERLALQRMTRIREKEDLCQAMGVGGCYVFIMPRCPDVHVANDSTHFMVHAARRVRRAGESIIYMQRRRHDIVDMTTRGLFLQFSVYLT